MTAQIQEILIYKDEQHRMSAEPLFNYWALGGPNPSFRMRTTALWRGYVGTWSVIKNRLYLTGIDANHENGKQATLESLFPGYPERVFAHWFSGRVRLPQGDVVEYIHAGYASVYEADLFLDFEDGVLVGEELKSNLPEAQNQ